MVECGWNLPRTREVKILKRFGMMDCKSMTTPMASNLKFLSDASSKVVDAMMYRQMIRSLMYLTNMRPDICFSMNTLIQFLTDSRHVHLIAAKHILRYLRGTVDYGIKYEANQKIMWIFIGQEVPLIGIALRGAT